MSLESAQRTPRVTSFLIKDILAPREEDNTSETTLYEDSISLKAPHSSALKERGQNSPKPFPFSDSRIGFGQVTGVRDVHKDRSNTKPHQNPNTTQFEHHVSSGKFSLA